MKTLINIISIVLTVASFVYAADQTGAIDQNLIDRYDKAFQDKDGADILINAVANNAVNNLTLNRDLFANRDKFFNLKLKSYGITNQKSSGRCWLFATLNVFNQQVAKKINHKNFELSQPYLTFWDKMEKANMFLEEVIKYIDKPLDSREMEYILRNPFGDGGFWTYAVNLIEKYGAMPITAMPETKQSTSTGTVNNLANMKLKKFAEELRALFTDGQKITDLRKRKEAMLDEIYQLMAYNYGRPPKEFVFRYEDKSDDKDKNNEDDEAESDEDSTATENPEPVKYITKTYTPRSFYDEFIAGELLKYVTLINYPTQPYNQPYRWEWGNMPEKPHIIGLNLPIEKLKAYTIRMLADSMPVCFACDVGYGNNTDSGIFAADLYQYNRLFDLDFKMTKAERLNYRGGTSNHMMVILGVDTTDDGLPVKWLVENSWGDARGDKGFWYMYDDWFSEYVYEVYLDPKYLSAEDRESSKKQPRDMPLWDYYGEGMLSR
ncbi:MAG: C1 family peptidase [Candidatus Zixiibacteriota bacterium]